MRTKGNRLLDHDIRRALREWLNTRVSSNDLVLDEMQLREFDAIVDVAVVGSEMRAFEIKSDADSLARLERQALHYGKVFDECTLVVTDARREAALSAVPAWWGVLVATVLHDSISIIVAREVERNPDVVVPEILMMLRRDELIDILRANAARRAWRDYEKHALIDAVLRIIGAADSRLLALEILRTRRTWTERQLGARNDEERVALATRWPLPNLCLAPSLLAS